MNINDFGNINVGLKPSAVGKSGPVVDCVIEDQVQEGIPYYMFLVDGRPRPDRLRLLQQEIKAARIYSYIIISAINCIFNLEKGSVVDYMLAHKSRWAKYLEYKGAHCASIMTFGPALYSVTKSADLLVKYFYADQFIRPYFYIGDQYSFCEKLNTFVYPVDAIADLFPDITKNVFAGNYNWRTRFFLKQLKAITKPDKWVPDMRPIVKHDLTTAEEITKVLNENMHAEAVAYDTETTGLDTTRDKVVCLTITWDGVNGYYMPWDLINKRLLTANIESCKHRITQNGKFDCKIMWTNGLPVFSCEPTDDTGQMAHAIHSDRARGLKPLAFYFTYFGGYDLGLDKFKSETGVINYSWVPHDILSEYAIIDAIATFRSYYAMDELITEIDKKFPNDKMPEWTLRRWYEEVMMPVYPDFIEMEYRGFYVDRQAQEEGQKALWAKQAELAKKMSEAWNVPETFEFWNTNAVGKLFEQLQWPPVERGKTGAYSTSDSCLNEWKRLGYPCIDELKQYRTNQVFLNTFLGHTLEDSRGWNEYIRPDPDGQYRIHCDFNVNGTTSYRNIGREPNLQQIPVHDDNARYVMKMITVPSIEELTVSTDKGNVYKGIADDIINNVKFGDLKVGSTITTEDGQTETVTDIKKELSHDQGLKHYKLCTGDFGSLQCRLATIDTCLNPGGMDQTLKAVYEPGGLADLHCMTGFNTFVSALHRQVYDVTDDKGKNWVFLPQQKIRISRGGEEQVIYGAEIQETDEILGYAK